VPQPETRVGGDLPAALQEKVDGVEFSEAWRGARARTRRSGPRRAAVRAAFDATRALPGIKRQPAKEIRAALTAELTARGVGDCSPSSVETMVRAIGTSRQQVAAELAAGGARKAWATWQLLCAQTMPTWLNPPANAEHLPTGDVDHVVTTRVVLNPEDPRLLGRLLSDLRPPTPADEADAEASRVFLCWLALEPETPGTVMVHAGASLLGHLPDDTAREVAAQLAALAGEGKRQTVEAELRGDTLQTITVQLFVPVVRTAAR
jgi:hypothetical protein